VVRAFGRGASERERVARQGERLKAAMVVQARTLAGLRAVGEVTGGLTLAAVLTAGAWQVAAGRATIATVVGAMTALGILLPAFRDLGLVYGYWASARVSGERIAAFLATPALVREAPGAPDLQVGEGHLELRGVDLAEGLRGFSGTAAGGRVTAVVGPNGSGKSTLLALAARLLDPDAGAVLVDGQDLTAVSLRSVRRHIALVSPDLPLLRGTVEHNLRYRNPEVSDDEYRRVVQECRVDEVLDELPNGARTRVTEAGTNLSQGQRTRIALARALLDRPTVLLLDETDANLDPRSVSVLDGVLERYEGTVLMVTHRLERAARADRIWMLEGGRLVEAGPSRSLLQSGGPTARFFGTAVALAG
jgi:ABC-type multidrug transport system fused ATPase/permease subunit